MPLAQELTPPVSEDPEPELRGLERHHPFTRRRVFIVDVDDQWAMAGGLGPVAARPNARRRDIGTRLSTRDAPL
jgi:hypothetical protein